MFMPYNNCTPKKEKVNPPALKGRNARQVRQIEHSISKDMVVVIGPAGCGKTYLSAKVAGSLFKDSEISNILLVRPTVECGRSLGALPGDLDEKYGPWLREMRRVLREELGDDELDKQTEARHIYSIPLQYMRGDTYNNTVVIIDEAQNTTVPQMKMTITRMGTNAKLYINGDVAQCDLPNNVESGLVWLVREIEDQKAGITIVAYEEEDCVRSSLCRKALKLIANASS
jgi:phosphate starvation-inducible PhoH-like protein